MQIVALSTLLFRFSYPLSLVTGVVFHFFRFKTFGDREPHRPPEDIAFSVARFFQKGGSVHNYYMVFH